MRIIIVPVLTSVLLGLPLLRAELVTRLVVLKLQSSAAPAARAALAENAANPEAMDAVLQLPGVSELARFTETDPWRRGLGFLTHDTGRIAFEGESKKNLGVQIFFHEPDISRGIEEILSSTILLPTSNRGYREFGNTDNGMIATLGKWQERACWGDATATLMLWQYVTAQGQTDQGRTTSDGKIEAVRVEMRWFKAALGDVEKVARSKPETRDTALQWITDRAKLWKECGFRVRPGDAATWQDVRAKYAAVDGHAVATKDSFSVRATISNDDGHFRIDWDAAVRDAEMQDSASLTLSATPATGIWEFVVFEGLAETNLVACRLTPDTR